MAANGGRQFEIHVGIKFENFKTHFLAHLSRRWGGVGERLH